jgi:hypothetical protein
MIERAEAERLVDAEKDCGGDALQWMEHRSPAKGVIIRKTLEVVVGVSPAPSSGDLMVIGLWTGADHIQLFLRLVGKGRGDTNLARLCIDPTHHGDIHWHWFEGAKGQTELEPVSHPGGKMDEGRLLNEVFVPRMQLTNIAEPML